MATLNELLRDGLTRHQVQLQAVVKAQRIKILNLLAQTEKEIYRQVQVRLKNIALTGADFGPTTTARLKLLEKILRDKRVKTFDRVFDVLDAEMQKLVKAEAVFVAELIRDVTAEAGINVKLNLVLPSVNQLRALVTKRPVLGHPLFDWRKRIAISDLNAVMAHVRTGLIQGQTSAAIAKGLRDSGALTRTRSQMETLVRTSVNFFGSQARQALYEENDDIIGEEQYTATLDSATTEQCAALDGERFPVGEGPQPPIHWNCRSVRIPVIDGQVLGNRPEKRVSSEDLKGLNARERRAKIRELTGTVPASTTYEEFLRRQSVGFQEEVLGVKKAALFREGNLKLSKFIDNRTFQPKTLAQLYKENPRAARAAGLI